MEHRFNVSRMLNRIADFFEIAIAGVLLVAAFSTLIHIVLGLLSFDLFTGGFDLDELLSDLFAVIICMEFTRMLCKHTPGTIIEVLMFATARQMIVEHLGSWETLLGIVSIGVLFAIQKFLQPDESERDGNVYVKNIRHAIREKNRSREEQKEG